MAYIGCHLSIDKGIDGAVQKAIELGANAIQVFLSPPQSSSAGKAIKNGEEIQQILKATGVRVVCHGKYILNFCRKGVAWQHNALVADLRKAHTVHPKMGVVIHQGKNVKTLKLSRSEALDCFVDGIKAVIKATGDIKNPIILENSCQQGTELGYTVEELAEIWGKFTAGEKDRLGFCWDTCHAFVAGTVQFKDEKDTDAFFEKFDNLIGMKYMKVIHFNDSSVKFDGHNDHHDQITKGFITDPNKGGDPSGLKRVLKWAREFEIPCILETPAGGGTWGRAEEIELLNKWSEEVGDFGGKKKSKGKKG